jgi:hypothetical protein
MAFEAIGWNAILVGAWNTAILTPDWIAKNLFGIPEGTPIPVEIPLNFRGPWRVRKSELALSLGVNAIEISLDRMDHQLLEEARTICAKALELLPKTPVSAAGFNFRFKSADVPIELASIFPCQLDSNLSDCDFAIKGRSLRRTLEFGTGLIHLDITYSEEEGGFIQVNFHQSSQSEDVLRSWLLKPSDEIREVVEKIIGSIPGVSV